MVVWWSKNLSKNSWYQSICLVKDSQKYQDDELEQKRSIFGL